MSFSQLVRHSFSAWLCKGSCMFAMLCTARKCALPQTVVVFHPSLVYNASLLCLAHV